MKLMSEIVANSCIKLCFHLGSGVEIQAMSQHMGLTSEQRDVLYELDRGEAICRVGLGYTDPVRLKIHDFEEQNVNDEELEELMQPKWDALLEGIEPAIRDRGIGSSEKPIQEAKRKEIPAAGSGALPKTRLSGDEEVYLRTVKSHPWRLISELHALLTSEEIMGIAALRMNRAVDARKSLMRKGFLESVDIKGTGRQGKSECNIITEKAGIGAAYKPRGDNLHGFWCHRIAEYFKADGATVKMGDTSSGQEIDIGVILQGKSIGVEIVVSGLVVENLSKHLSYCDEVLVLCIDSKKKKEIEQELGIDFLD